MAKTLEQILKGVKSSTTKGLTTGADPGVDYADKSADIRKELSKLDVEKIADRVGNGDDVYQATNIKKAALKKGEKPAPRVTTEETLKKTEVTEEVEPLQELTGKGHLNKIIKHYDKEDKKYSKAGHKKKSVEKAEKDFKKASDARTKGDRAYALRNRRDAHERLKTAKKNYDKMKAASDVENPKRKKKKSKE